MKKFDLAAAKAGQPVCTREGLPVRILCFDKKRKKEELDEGYPIVALITLPDGSEALKTYTNKGTDHLIDAECGLDLMMATVKKRGYVNVWVNPTENDTYIQGAYETEDIARSGLPDSPEGLSGYEYKDTVIVEWEE